MFRLLNSAVAVAVLTSAACGQQSMAHPEKVTLLVDAELPVPFATADAIQSVKAGTEVFLKGVNGDKVKVAHGVGEGYVHHTQTDYARRAEDFAKNPPPPQPPAQKFRPYNEPIVFERVTQEEAEKRAIARKQELQNKAEQDRQERERQAEEERQEKLRERERKQLIGSLEKEKKRLDVQIESEKKQVEILKKQQALAASPEEHLFIAERINRYEGWLKQNRLERKNVIDSLYDLENERP